VTFTRVSKNHSDVCQSGFFSTRCQILSDRRCSPGSHSASRSNAPFPDPRRIASAAISVPISRTKRKGDSLWRGMRSHVQNETGAKSHLVTHPGSHVQNSMGGELLHDEVACIMCKLSLNGCFDLAMLSCFIRVDYRGMRIPMMPRTQCQSALNQIAK
jgi:hypothetical protein